MRKIAVVFPGIGYTKDRPLLYYAGKKAISKGYELVNVTFTGLNWNKEKIKDKKFLEETLEKCLGMTETSLAELGDISGDEIVFISKSIGTVVATAYASKNNLNVSHICFSPLEYIGEFINEKSGILLYGDNDPFADYTVIERIAEDKELDTFRVAGGNHSLETGDISKDIDDLKVIMDRLFV